MPEKFKKTQMRLFFVSFYILRQKRYELKRKARHSFVTNPLCEIS